MSLLSDLLNSPHFFDDGYKRRNDIESLKTAIANAPDPVRLVVPLMRRVDQLELLSKAMFQLLVAKNLFTQAEISVVMQQLDLADGTEDNRMTTKPRRNAPRCAACQRYVNPQRDQCVYCGAAVQVVAEGGPRVRRTVTCTQCSAVVPEDETYFTGNGLQCERCYRPADPA